MPGAHAHLALVNVAAEPSRLQAAGLPPSQIVNLARWRNYLELGALSPDYPYLDILSAASRRWADSMHYVRSEQMLLHGARLLSELASGDREKAGAWLLGYAAHVVADMTIHPVIELLVGPYAQCATAHRECEMHQDAHIYSTLNLGQIGQAEYLATGVARCCDERGELHPAIRTLWKAMLREVHPQQFEDSAPRPERWHSRFSAVVGAVEESGRLLPLARHVSVGLGLTYPLASEVNPCYVTGLPVPGRARERTTSYDELFSAACKNIVEMWRLLDASSSAPDEGQLLGSQAWNLDTGRDSTGSLVYWSGA